MNGESDKPVAASSAKPDVALAVRSTSATPAAKPAAKRPAARPTARPAARAAAPTAAVKKPAPAKPAPLVRKTATKAAPVAAKKTSASKPTKVKKSKLVRDSFTMPEGEYAEIAALKKRCQKLGRSAKKSEILRAAIANLAKLSDSALLAAIQQLAIVKTGRPAKGSK